MFTPAARHGGEIDSSRNQDVKIIRLSEKSNIDYEILLVRIQIQLPILKVELGVVLQTIPGSSESRRTAVTGARGPGGSVRGPR